jgi:uncharacterized paraquat-inducible protein A
MQHKCPNCGHDVEMPPVASPTGDYCPNCGALLTEFNSKGNSWKVILLSMLLGIILLGSFAMGLFGACLILIGSIGGTPSIGVLMPGVLIFVAAIVIGVLCVRGLTKIKK